MSDKHTEINDNEIRVISFEDNSSRRWRHRLRNILLLATAILILVVICISIIKTNNGTNKDTYQTEQVLPTEPIDNENNVSAPTERGFLQIADTIVGGTMLKIITPENLRPSLAIGSDALNDTTAMLVVQAADVRADNGEIAGTYVFNGELISKGEAKAGFCSIINGELTIGVADASPMLEQALTSGGYFFRQYPLVVGGQIVENKPKGKAMRRALAEIEGKLCVIISQDRLTFHDFSQALTDAGVRNAIYLVGGDSSGFYIDTTSRNISLGSNPDSTYTNVNYIVWH